MGNNLKNYKAKVSMLIPVYNSGEFIFQTIRSAVDQTWPYKEIIIVDDGSTDDSYRIACEFRSEKVKVYQQENAGTCNARNKAFEYSTGDFIQYLDADDLLSEDKITEQIKLFEKYGSSIVASCRWDKFYQDPEEATFPHRYQDKDWEYPIDWLINSWEGKGVGQTSIWLTPRKLIENAGPWNESLQINQDGEFFNRVLLQASAIKYSPKAKVYYRTGNPESISRKASRAKAESLLLSFRLYVTDTLSYIGNDKVRHALMMNFLRFIYQYYEIYPDLVQNAKEEIHLLGFSKLEITGGRNFRRIANILGFENTLKLRKAMKGIFKQ